MQIKVKPDGSYRIEGLIVVLNEAAEYAFTLAKVSRTNYSDFHISTTLGDCMDRIKSNLSDYGVGIYTLYDPDSFKVPAIEQAGTISIFTGYNVAAYLAKSAVSVKYSILQNLKLYDSDIYFATFCLILALFFAYSLDTAVKLCRRRHFRPSFERATLRRRYFQLFSRSIADLFYQKGGRVKLLSFTFHLGVFLILLPFLLLFKTTQVVNVKPEMIRSFEEIMARNVSIYYANISMNETIILEPNFNNAKEKDISFRFWSYWNKRKIRFESIEDLQKYFEQLKRMVKMLVEKKTVYFDISIGSSAVSSILCMLSMSPDLYKIIMFKDESTREIIAGWGMSLYYENRRLIYKKKVSIEAGLNVMKSIRLPNYETQIQIKDLHFYRQKQICMHGTDAPYHSKTVGSGIRFFHSAFVVLTGFVLIAIIRFIIERSSRPKRRKRCKSKLAKRSCDHKVVRHRRVRQLQSQVE